MSDWLQNRAQEMLARLSSSQRQAYFRARLDGSSAAGLDPAPFGESRDRPFDVVSAALSDEMRRGAREVYDDAVASVRAAIEELLVVLSRSLSGGVFDEDSRQKIEIGKTALNAIDGAACERFSSLVRAVVEMTKGQDGLISKVHIAAVSAMSALRKDAKDIAFWVSLTQADSTALLACRALVQIAPKHKFTRVAVAALKERWIASGDQLRLAILGKMLPASMELSRDEIVGSKSDNAPVSIAVVVPPLWAWMYRAAKKRQVVKVDFPFDALAHRVGQKVAGGQLPVEWPVYQEQNPRFEKLKLLPPGGAPIFDSPKHALTEISYGHSKEYHL
jgi:hypothetical protein